MPTNGPEPDPPSTSPRLWIEFSLIFIAFVLIMSAGILQWRSLTQPQATLLASLGVIVAGSLAFLGTWLTRRSTESQFVQQITEQRDQQDRALTEQRNQQDRALTEQRKQAKKQLIEQRRRFTTEIEEQRKQAADQFMWRHRQECWDRFAWAQEREDQLDLDVLSALLEHLAEEAEILNDTTLKELVEGYNATFLLAATERLREALGTPDERA